MSSDRCLLLATIRRCGPDATPRHHATANVAASGNVAAPGDAHQASSHSTAGIITGLAITRNSVFLPAIMSRVRETHGAVDKRGVRPRLGNSPPICTRQRLLKYVFDRHRCGCKCIPAEQCIRTNTKVHVRVSRRERNRDFHIRACNAVPEFPSPTQICVALPNRRRRQTNHRRRFFVPLRSYRGLAESAVDRFRDELIHGRRFKQVRYAKC